MIVSIICVVSVSVKADQAEGLIDQVKKIRIGVLALRGEKKAIEMWQPTADYLSNSIYGYQFSIVPLNNGSIMDAVRDSEIDFVLSNPASYATLEKEYGVTRLATLKNRRLNGVYTQFGALIFTRNDRDDINNVTDLVNKSFMAVHPNAFGGWWMALRVFKQKGIDPENNFSRLEFSGFPQDKVVYAVRDGKIDAGTVRTDLLERMFAEGKIDIKDFKVLNPKKQTKEFPFAHSTTLYPEWAFATSRHTADKLAQRVTIALLSLPADHYIVESAKSAGWTVPLDYQRVHDLMMELHVGPYKNLGEFNIVDVIKKYGVWIALVAAAVICMVVVIIIVSRLNRQLSHSKASLEKSKSALEQEIIDRKKAELAEKIQMQRIRALYEISAMPGLSFDEQIERTIKLGCRMFNLEIGKLCRIDEENNINEFIKVVAPDDVRIKAGIKLDLPNTLCSITYDRDDPLAINFMGDSKYKDHPSYDFTGLEAYIGTPIWVNGKKYGTINFSSLDPTVTFTESDKDIISLIGRWISVTFERQYAEEETRSAKEDAEIANHTKSAFLANMSHELRTPLNAVIGYSELIEDELQEIGDEEIIADAKKINSAGQNLLALINGVLDLSKIEAGKIDLDIGEIKVPMLIDEIETTILPLAKKDNNQLKVNIDKNIELLESDHTKLRQVLLNLLSNACKFTRQGVIQLIVHEVNENETDWVCFRIIDTGMGIAPEETEKLFDEFSQAGKAEDKNKGTGLGLAISRKLCRILGGDITLESQLGKGSIFTVMLPKHFVAVEPVNANNKANAA